MFIRRLFLLVLPILASADVAATGVAVAAGVVAPSKRSAQIESSLSTPQPEVDHGSADLLPLSRGAAATRDTVGTRLSHLKALAAQGGLIRVIAGVRMPFTPDASLLPQDAARQKSAIANVQAAILKRVPMANERRNRAQRFSSIPFMAMELDAAELDALASDPDIASIEEDRLFRPSLSQSSPLIGASTANSGGYTGTGTVVAILDSGVDKTHPFLSGKVVSEACYSTTYSGYASTSVCPGGVSASTVAGSGMHCSIEGCEHGTHVAGIVAGSTTSFSGVAPGAGLIAIQVFSRFDDSATCGGSAPCILTYTSDQIRALERVYDLRSTYAIASVNMSLGGGRYTVQGDCDSANLALKAAIDNLRSANIATLIASGNEGYIDSIAAPGCISTAISVGSTHDAAGQFNDCDGHYLGSSSVDEIACYSNSAPFLNLLAPGSLINSAIPDGRYANFNGTSMATPQVAGAWALMKQKLPALTVTQGLNALVSTGTAVVDPRNGVSKRRVNIHQALNTLGGGTSSYTLTVSKAGAGSGTVASTISGISCGTDCTENYGSGTSVTLNASAASGSVFAGWSGDCSGTGSCTVTMSSAKSVIANFNLQTSSQPDLIITAASAPSTGISEGEITISFTMKNQGAADSDASWLGILVSTDNIISRLDNDTGWGCDMGTLAPGASQNCSGPITLPKLAAGTYYLGAIADYGDTILESVETNNARSASNATLVSAPPDDHFPYAGQIPGWWSTKAGSAAGWSVAQDFAHMGSYSLKSGVIGHSQFSTIELRGSFSAGYVRFARKVSSESGWDFLRFYVDGVQKAEWSGEEDWAEVAYAITAGSHTLTWEYLKDGSVSSGSDAAWIDSVTLPGNVPAAPVLTRLFADNETLRVYFTAVGLDILGYLATCSDEVGSLTVYSASSPITFTGLTNGVTYACQVRAVNVVGTGPASAALSQQVRPRVNISPIINLLLGN